MMESLITVEEALEIVLSNTRDFGIEEIPLKDAMGRILREEIVADRDFPPYDRVTMDGIAIRYDIFKNGRRTFEIVGIAAAGDKQQHLENDTACLEVMTGAVMPSGADAVIRYEDVTIHEGKATINIEDIQYKQNIHFRGEDRIKGDVIIRPGIKISASEIGVCATVGKAVVTVSRLPKIIVISTGDELVDIDETPEPHQIRRSNVYRLSTVLSHYKIPVHSAHLPDERDIIERELSGYLKDYDVILISGGVSKGKFDFLPDALEASGVKKLFHKIKQRPGKPFWFGVHEQATVFAFPGNPVSSFMCMQQYFRPWLNKSLGERDHPEPKAVLSEDVRFKPDLTYFLEVRLKFDEEGRLIAKPVKGNGSGDLANLVDAEAFIILPSDKELFKAGEVYPILPYRSAGFD